MPPMRFITIRGSHYVERARWAMDLAGLSYEEDSSPPLIHMLSTMSARPAGSKAHSVPMLLTPDAGVLTDSADIVAYAHRRCHAPNGTAAAAAAAAGTNSGSVQPQNGGNAFAASTKAGEGSPAASLYPEDPALLAEVHEVEKLCAQRLGVWTRVIIYQYLIKDNKLFYEALAQGCSPSRRRMLWAMFYPIKSLMVAGMRINAANAAKCLEKVRGLFAELGEKLQGGRRRYLVGDTFTAADLTFASMAAIVLLPEEYGGKRGTVDLSTLRTAFDPAVLKELRDSVAGRHALDMYRLHRLPAGTAPSGLPASL